jgi:hypothetical protein
MTIGAHQRYKMINIYVIWIRPSCAIVITEPGPRSSFASVVSRNIGSVPLEHVFASVAIPTDRDPGVEEVSVVWRAIGFVLHEYLSQVRLRCRDRDWCWEVSSLGERKLGWSS